MVILQVNTRDVAGGSEAVARNLLDAYGRLGHDAYLAVGSTIRSQPNVVSLAPHDRKTAHGWLCRRLPVFVNRITRRNTAALERRLRAFAGPARRFRRWRGHEDFDYPHSRQLLQHVPQVPDVVHCHNLHGGYLPAGGYFDLRYLSELSRMVPVVLTLHDAWLLSGHCAHSLACERWENGCGSCPDLTLYPAIQRDATARNWEVKRNIFAESRLYIATPCRWLMDRVDRSMLKSSVAAQKVIPNGIDLAIFKPAVSGTRMTLRREANIPLETTVMVTVAAAIKTNPWKDYAMLRRSIALVGELSRDQDMIMLIVGDSGPTERIGGLTIRFIPFIDGPERIAALYQLADIYLHPARADTFPNTVIEALACGVPVVATAVGGIPEQIKGLRDAGAGNGMSADGNSYAADDATGVLVAPGSADGMAEAVMMLSGNALLRKKLGANAALDAAARYDLSQQVQRYLDWYSEILVGRNGGKHTKD